MTFAVKHSLKRVRCWHRVKKKAYIYTDQLNWGRTVNILFCFECMSGRMCYLTRCVLAMFFTAFFGIKIAHGKHTGMGKEDLLFTKDCLWTTILTRCHWLIQPFIHNTCISSMTISKTRLPAVPAGLVSKERTWVPVGLHILLEQMKEYICCFNSQYSGKQQPPQVSWSWISN